MSYPTDPQRCPTCHSPLKSIPWGVRTGETTVLCWDGWHRQP